jgi:putative ABC transport system substrate-binding protein
MAKQRTVVGLTMLKNVTLIAILFVATPVAGEAQLAAKVPRIGVLSAGTMTAASNNDEAFKQGLREHGYVEGQNIVLERRYGEGRGERMAEIAAELVRMQVDVIVATSDSAIAALKRQTRSEPGSSRAWPVRGATLPARAACPQRSVESGSSC